MKSIFLGVDNIRKVIFIVALYGMGFSFVLADNESVGPVIASVNINSCVGSITISVTSGTAPYSYSWQDGSGNNLGVNSFFIDNLVADDYRVTVTDADGNSVAATYTVTNPPDLVGSVVVNDVSCKAGSDAQVIISMDNGNPPYGWELYNDNLGNQLSTGTSNSPVINLSGLGVGDYRFEVADLNGCTGTIYFSITEPADFLAYNGANVTDARCFNSTDGAISINVTGGWGSYSYQWIRVSDGAVVSTNEDATGLAPGDYFLRITDVNTGGNACIITTTNYTVGSPPEITASASFTGVSCKGNSDGAIDLSVAGGVGPYTFAWNTGATSEDISGLVAGNYEVLITDSSNCTSTATFTVTEPNTLTIDPLITDVNCFGEGTGRIRSRVSGGTKPYSYLWSTGNTGKNLNNKPAGTYSLVVTDANGCTASVNSLVISQPTAPLTKIDETLVLPSCFGANDGTAAVNLSGGTGPYTYDWSNGATTATAVGLTAGSYTVVITDDQGCSLTETVVLNNPPKIAIAPSLTLPSCNGLSDGSISVVASNGTGPYTYTWNTGASGPDLTNVVAGNYTVTATDSGGCSVTETITLGQPGLLSGNAVINDISCNGANDGSIFLAVSGGTGPYTYNWSNGSTSNNINGLIAGNYSVTIEDDSGCIISETYTVVDPAPIGITFKQTDLVCKGASTGQIDISPSGGTLPYSYLWSNGSMTEDLTNVVAGSYTVTVKDAENCSVNLTVTLTEPSTVLELSGTSTNVTCHGSNNGSIDLEVDGGAIPYSYLWSNGAVTQDINGLSPGNYSVAVTDNNGCIKSLGFTISQPSPLASSNTLSNVTCFGNDDGSIEVSPSGGTAPYSFQWADDINITSENRSSLRPGSYTVTITDDQGCQLVQNLSVTEPTALNAAISQADVSCFGESTGAIDLTVSGGVTPYTFSWSNGATTEDLSSLSANSYSVVIQDANGCSITENVTINQPPSALALSGSANQITCNGAADGIINVSVTGGSAPYSYSWSNGLTTQDLSGLTAGNYVLTVTDNKGCQVTESYTITDPPVLLVSGVATDALCRGNNDGGIDISVTGGEGPYSFTWSNGETTEDISGLSPGSYTVNVLDSRGCGVSQSFTINEPLELALSYTSTEVDCKGANSGAIDITVSGGTAPYSYAWDNGSISEDLSNITAGSYQLVVTDIKGCTITQSVVINEPNFDLTDQAVVSNISCFGGSDGSIQLNPTGGTAPYTYSWNTGQTSKDIFGLSAGSYQVVISDFNGCTFSVDYTIVMPPALQATGTDTDILCNGATDGAVDLTVTGGTLPYTFVWSNGETTEDLSGISAGNYQVTIVDAAGCSLVRSFQVTEPLALNLGTSKSDVTCFGAADGSIQLNVSGGVTPYSYAWSNGESTDGIYNLSGGNYSVTITDGNGCSTLQNFVISEPVSALQVVGVVSDENCFGDQQGGIDISISGGTAPYDISWNNGSKLEDIIGLGRGNYQVTVVDQNGCSTQSTFTVGGPDVLTSTVTSSNVLCNGGSDGAVDLTVTGGTLPYTFVWSNGETTEDLSGISAGNYQVVITDANGCSESRSVVVTEPLVLSGTFNVSDVSCFGASDGDILTSITGGSSPYSYSWSNGETSRNLNNISGGVYELTVTDASGCSLVESFVVGEPVSALQVVGVVSDENCFGDQQGGIDISISGGTAPYDISWNNGSKLEDIIGLGRGNYQVTVVDQNGCSTQSTFTVGGPDVLTSTVTSSNVLCNGGSDGAVDLTVTGGTLPYTFVWSNGETTEDLSGISAGNYQVVITDANGCSESRSVVVTEPLVLSGTFNVSDVSCFGASDGDILTSITGGSSPYSYSWSNGETSRNLNNISGGVYELTVTDASGCSLVESFVVGEPVSALQVVGVVSDENCFGDQQGGIDISISGGTAPYDISWNNGSKLEDIIGLGRGNYQVTVVDQNGCSTQSTFTVGGPDVLTSTVTSSNVLCNGGSDGALDLTVTGGTLPYTFVWSNGETTEDLSGISAGNYQVVITDANGCSESRSVVVTEPLVLSGTFNVSDVSCFGASDGDILTSITGGSSPYSYSWSNGETSRNLNNISGGVYELTVTDASGCSLVESFVVGEPVSALQVVGVVSDENCFGDQQGGIDISISGGTAPYDISWNNGSKLEDIIGLGRGNYQVTVVDQNGCSTQSTFTVGGPDVLTSTVTSSNVLCNGGSDGALDLTVTGGTLPYTFVWSNGETTEDLSGISAGNYQVVITDANGCSESRSVVVTEPLVLSGTFNVSDVSCFGASDGDILTSITGGSSPYSYSWSNGETSRNLNNISGGVYELTVTDASGCSLVESFVVGEPVSALQVVGVVSDENCFGDQQGGIDISISGGTAPYDISWNNGSKLEDIIGLGRGNYQVTVVDQNGCSTQSTFTVGGPDVLTSTVTSSNVLCNGGSDGAVDLTVTGGTLPYTFVWSNGETTEDLSGISAGNYQVVITDANGCSESRSVVVTEPLVLSGTFNVSDVSCFGASDGDILTSITGGSSPYSYSWSNGETSRNLNNISGGVYELTVTDASGCSLVESFVVGEPVSALQVVGVVSDENCFGDQQGGIDISISGGTAPYDISWNNGSKLEDIIGLGRGNYQVTVVDQNGCSTQSTFTVGGPDVLTSTVTSSNVLCNGGSDGALDLTVTGGTLPYTFVWSNGETTEDLSGISAGNYQVVITDANGCSESRSVVVTEPLVLSGTFNVSDVSCFGASDGDILTSITGGSSPYSYSWSNGETSRNLNNISGGVYELTVTDASGCSLVESFVVGEPVSALQVVGVVSDENCFGDQQGGIDISISGGTAPYDISWNNGSKLEDIIGLGRGNYQVTVVDQNGCSTQSTFTVGGPLQLNMSASVQDVSCFGAQDGSLSITPSGGTSPYTYSWSNGAITQDISGLGEGSYVLTITDANNCSINRTFDIQEPLPLVINYTQSDVSCFGADDGQINVTPSGGNLPYSFSWSDGSKTKDLHSLSGGDYTLLVTDAKGCTITETISISAPDEPLNADVIINDLDCAGQPTGQIQVTPVGGTGPYSYSWSNGSNQEDQVGLFAGTYALTITDSKGCRYDTSYTIVEPDELSISFDISNTSCFGDADGSILPIVTGGSAPYNYLWSNGSTSQDQIDISSGTYNLTVIDSKGCSITKAAIVGDSEDLLIEVKKRDVYCKGEASGTIELDVTGGSGQYTYAWDNGENQGILTNLKAGIYSVLVSDVGGCSARASVVISEPAQSLAATITGSTELSCFGDRSGYLEAIVSGGVAPYTYLWSNGQRTSAIAGVGSGNYTLSVKDSNDCLVQVNWTISQPQEPITIQAQGKLNLDCKADGDGFIEVSIGGGSGNYDILWSTGETTTRIEQLVQGDYTIRVRDGQGCVEERIFTVTEPEELTLGNAVINESQCYDDRNGSIELNVTGGTGPYTYQWEGGETTKNRIGISSGTYSVLVTDTNGCQVQGNYTLSTPELFAMSPELSPISCIGANDASIALNIEGGESPLVIQWSTGASSETVSNLSPGAYNVLITDKKGCTLQKTFNIIEPQQLSLDAFIRNADECNNPESGRINVIVTGGTKPYQYRWSNGATTSTLENVLPGTYVVEVSDKYGCTQQGTYTVLQPKPLQIGLSSAPYIDCENRIAGILVNADVTGGLGDYSYKWSRGNSANGEILLTAPGRLTLEITDGRGCYQLNSIDIDIPELADADFVYNAASLDETGELAINDPVSFFDQSTGDIIDWSWDFGDGFDSKEIDPIHVFDAPGRYLVTLLTTDRTNCTSSKTALIDLTEGYKLILPNAFTPNGDGNNDYFRPEMLGLTQVQLIIYNTWGEVVFSSQDIETKGWDGYVKGRRAENGNYVYKLVGTSFNGLKVERDGIFALLK